MATYVCSDIHGWMEHYVPMIKTLKTTDKLYVLGDVIDRGVHGITILLDLLARPNVIVMLGNHEYMMLRYYQAKQGRLENDEDEGAALTNWRYNHCAPTIKEFEALTQKAQQDLLDQVERMPIAICDLNIQDSCYYLVHGCPSTILTSGTITLQDCCMTPFVPEDLLWNRIDPKHTYFQDRCVISGHTPTLFFQQNTPYELWIQGADIQTSTLLDIDCGCAAQSIHSRIALLCLDDRSVRYF